MWSLAFCISSTTILGLSGIPCSKNAWNILTKTLEGSWICIKLQEMLQRKEVKYMQNFKFLEFESRLTFIMQEL